MSYSIKNRFAVATVVAAMGSSVLFSGCGSDPVNVAPVEDSGTPGTGGSAVGGKGNGGGGAANGGGGTANGGKGGGGTANGGGGTANGGKGGGTTDSGSGGGDSGPGPAACPGTALLDFLNAPSTSTTVTYDNSKLVNIGQVP